MKARQEQYIVHVGDRQMRLTFSQAFVLAHLELVAGRPDSAENILLPLEQAHPQGRQIKLLLARCYARRDNPAKCRVLCEAASCDGPPDVAERLCGAFLHRRFLLANAIMDTQKVLRKHRDLPGVHLFLGDTCLAVGRRGEAISAWQQAVANDAPEGLASEAARHQLRKFAPAPAATSAPVPAASPADSATPKEAPKASTPW